MTEFPLYSPPPSTALELKDVYVRPDAQSVKEGLLIVLARGAQSAGTPSHGILQYR